MDKPTRETTYNVRGVENTPLEWEVPTPQTGVENRVKNTPKKGGSDPPKKGGSDPPPRGVKKTPLLGGWRYTKQCKFWRDSSVLIQGVRRFLRTPEGFFGVPPKKG
jgi:hypothetical protein